MKIGYFSELLALQYLRALSLECLLSTHTHPWSSPRVYGSKHPALLTPSPDICLKLQLTLPPWCLASPSNLACPSLPCSYLAPMVKGWPYTQNRPLSHLPPSPSNSSAITSELLQLSPNWPPGSAFDFSVCPWELCYSSPQNPGTLSSESSDAFHLMRHTAHGHQWLFLQVQSSLLTHSSPVTPTPLLFLQHAQLNAQPTPASGILNLPFPLSEIFFPKDPHSTLPTTPQALLKWHLLRTFFSDLHSF